MNYGGVMVLGSLPVKLAHIYLVTFYLLTKWFKWIQIISAVFTFNIHCLHSVKCSRIQWMVLYEEDGKSLRAHCENNQIVFYKKEVQCCAMAKSERGIPVNMYFTCRRQKWRKNAMRTLNAGILYAALHVTLVRNNWWLDAWMVCWIDGRMDGW